MKVVGLISGGKDSTFALHECVRAGHEIICLANLYPANASTSELDSMMFQTVGHHGIEAYAQAMELPLIREQTKGKAIETGLSYHGGKDGDEVEDLYNLLKKVLKQYPETEAVSSGAVFSNYQRVRVENVCRRLGLTSLTYLWRVDQEELLDKIENSGIVAIIVKTASYGLSPRKLLGKTTKEVRSTLKSAQREFHLNICGEGGEYETFTLDCPLFKSRIEIDEIVLRGEELDNPIAPNGCVEFRKLHLVKKSSEEDDLKSSSQLGPTAPIASRKRINIVGNMAFAASTYSDHKFDVETGTIILTKILTDNLEESGFELSDVAICGFYLSDMNNYQSANNVYKSSYDPDTSPSRVCTELSMGTAVMMEAVASKSRQTLHVESISHWAPAMIGPYSQANIIEEKGLIFLAGMIGLIPGTMKLHTNLTAQVDQTWKSINAVLTSLESSPSASLTHLIFFKTGEMENNLHLVQNNSLCLKAPYCLYIGVPHLPKDALVEVKTTSILQKNFSKLQCYEEVSTDKQTNMSWRGVPGLSIFFLITSNARSVGVAVDCLEKMLKACLFNWDNVLILRLWISNRSSTPEQQVSLQRRLDQELNAKGSLAFSIIVADVIYGNPESSEQLFAIQALAVKA